MLTLCLLSVLAPTPVDPKLPFELILQEGDEFVSKGVLKTTPGAYKKQDGMGNGDTLEAKKTDKSVIQFGEDHCARPFKGTKLKAVDPPGTDQDYLEILGTYGYVKGVTGYFSTSLPSYKLLFHPTVGKPILKGKKIVIRVKNVTAAATGTDFVVYWNGTEVKVTNYDAKPIEVYEDDKPQPTPVKQGETLPITAKEPVNDAFIAVLKSFSRTKGGRAPSKEPRRIRVRGTTSGSRG